MKTIICFAIISIMLVSCSGSSQPGAEKKDVPAMQGTWRLLSGTLIEQNDTTVTDYTTGKSFIKVINETHFAFMGHDLGKGKDSAAFYTSGGGSYALKESHYTEHLEYCNDRQWEGNDFHFTVTISNDTLVQQGIEKVEAAGVDRINIEKYVRVK
jgi:hypothetical protein